MWNFDDGGEGDVVVDLKVAVSGQADATVVSKGWGPNVGYEASLGWYRGKPPLGAKLCLVFFVLTLDLSTRPSDGWVGKEEVVRLRDSLITCATQCK